MKNRALAAAALVATVSTTADGQTAPKSAAEIARVFGSREYVQNISLAPDGSKVAMVQPDAGRGTVLAVADFASGKPPAVILRTSGSDTGRLTACSWATSVRLVCELYFIDVGTEKPLIFTRLVSIDSDGSGLKLVTDRTNAHSTGFTQFGGSIIDYTGDGSGDGRVMIVRIYVPENGLGTNITSTKQGMGVDLVNVTTLAREIVETPKLTAADYISDGVGHVRILGTNAQGPNGYDRKTVAYSYRKKNDRDFQALGTFRIDGSLNPGFEPVAVDPKLDVVYGFDDADGRRALFRIALDGTKTREIVVARPDVDVDRLIRIGRQQRVVGASWAAEQRESIFFDPELKTLRASLARAIPKLPLIRFVDATTDEKILLLKASSDNDPGKYYLYDKTSHRLEEVMSARPQTQGMTLATVKPVSYRATDGTMVPAYLTLPPSSDGKNLPSIVLPHGGPAARDEWGFDWLAQFFAARGYAVLQPNFRGSSGYGDGWFEKNGFQSWRIAVGDVNDGGRWLVSQGIAAPGKLAIFGWSYGGYAALQSSVLDPDLFKAIVAVAPVTDLGQLRDESHFYTNFPIISAYIGSGPHVKEGSPARNAAAIKAPVLMFHGDLDQNVNIAQSRLMADRLRDAHGSVELVEYKGLDHQLDDSAVRAQMLEKSDAFLRHAMGL